MWIIPMLVYFVYHWMPALVVTAVCVLYMAALAPLCGMRGNLLAATLTSSVILSTLVSLHGYYAYVQPLTALQVGRTYSNVSIDEPAVAYLDAAVLEFAGNATVDASRAAGLMALEGGTFTYCVAPVVDSKFNDSDTALVQYWAIGVDCCDKNGGFACGDVDDESAHGGVVLHDPAHGDLLYEVIGEHFVPPERRMDLFQKAVERAAAFHDVAVPETVAFISWTSRSREDVAQERWVGIMLALFCFALFTGAVAAGLALMMSAYKSTQGHGVANGADIPPSVWAFIDHISVPRVDRHSMRKELTTYIGAYVVLLLSAIMWTWMPCLAAGNAILAVFLAGLVGGVAALLMTPHGILHGVLAIFMAVVGCYIGWSNYVRDAQFYCGVSGRRTYTDVRPDSKAAEYLDAGVLHFEKSATLGSQMLGYLHKGVTYCAAPVLSGRGDSPSRVDFWAVGTDCCSGRSNFHCFSKGSGDATSGVVVINSTSRLPLLEERSLRDEYLQAVSAAASAYNFTAAEEPILVHWGKDVDAVQHEWLENSLGRLLLVAGVGLLVIAVMASITIFCAAQHRWRLVRTQDWIHSRKYDTMQEQGERAAETEEDPQSSAAAAADRPASASRGRRLMESVSFRPKDL